MGGWLTDLSACQLHSSHKAAPGRPEEISVSILVLPIIPVIYNAHHMQFREFELWTSTTTNILQVQCNHHLISPDETSEIAIDDDAYYPNYSSVKLA